tara:strand:- start:2226 stop:2474 length:249 start_codon:yes stop_codon:yes gene_type:complete
MKSGDFSKKACNKCEFFRGLESGDRSAYQRGECRFNPPGEHGFPEIYSDWWCGKFQAYDNKSNTILNKSVMDKIEELRDDLL